MTQTISDHQLPPVELTSFEQLVLVSIAVLEQALDLVDESLEEDKQLSFNSNLIPGSTIGVYSILNLSHDFITWNL